MTPEIPPNKRATPLTMPSRSEEHTSELQSQFHLVCRLLLEKKKILFIQQLPLPAAQAELAAVLREMFIVTLDEQRLHLLPRLRLDSQRRVVLDSSPLLDLGA